MDKEPVSMWPVNKTASLKSLNENKGSQTWKPDFGCVFAKRKIYGIVGISDPSPCLLAVSPSADRIQIERWHVDSWIKYKLSFCDQCCSFTIPSHFNDLTLKGTQKGMLIYATDGLNKTCTLEWHHIEHQASLYFWTIIGSFGNTESAAFHPDTQIENKMRADCCIWQVKQMSGMYGATQSSFDENLSTNTSTRAEQIHITAQ